MTFEFNKGFFSNFLDFKMLGGSEKTTPVSSVVKCTMKEKFGKMHYLWIINEILVYWLKWYISQILVYWFHIFVVIWQRYGYLKSDKRFENCPK